MKIDTRDIRNGVLASLMGMIVLSAIMVMKQMAGQGLYGMGVGMVIPVMALMLHLVYGAVPGVAFGKLSAR